MLRQHGASTVTDIADVVVAEHERRDHISPRMRELERKGLVRLTGEKRLPLSAAYRVKQQVWEAVPVEVAPL